MQSEIQDRAAENLCYAYNCHHGRYFTELSIIILLFGSIVGAILQCGEAGAIGLEYLSSHVSHWLIDRSGSLLMAIGTMFIAYPLCHYSRLQEVCLNCFIVTTFDKRLHSFQKQGIH